MELWRDDDELYPVFSLSETTHYGSVRVELSDQEYQDYLRVEKEWEDWQKKLKTLGGWH